MARVGSASTEGCDLGLGLVGGRWVASASASGLPMYLTAARSFAFGARTPWYRWRWTRPTLHVGARRYKASEPLEKLKRREQQLSAAVRRRLGQPIDELGLGRGKGDDTAGCVEPFQGEGRPSTVAEQPFHAGSVVTLDANGRVDAEPAGSLPGKHAVGVGFVE